MINTFLVFQIFDCICTNRTPGCWKATTVWENVSTLKYRPESLIGISGSKKGNWIDGNTFSFVGRRNWPVRVFVDHWICSKRWRNQKGTFPLWLPTYCGTLFDFPKEGQAIIISTYLIFYLWWLWLVFCGEKLRLTMKFMRITSSWLSYQSTHGKVKIIV